MSVDPRARRLPVASPTMLVLMADLEVWRERHGVEKCRERKIGPMRERLIAGAYPETFITPAGVWNVGQGVREARMALALHCRRCGGCDLAKS